MIRAKVLVAVCLIALYSCGQKPELYDQMSQYKLVSKGESNGYPFVKKYINTADTCYTVKEVYLDSAYENIISRHFFFKDLLDGPFYTYVKGRLSRSGFYKKGRSHGERTTYFGNVIIERAFFEDGVKVGTWEKYNQEGKLVSKTKFVKGEVVEVR